VAGVLVAAVIFAVTLVWAKWWPYAGRIGEPHTSSQSGRRSSPPCSSRRPCGRSLPVAPCHAPPHRGADLGRGRVLAGNPLLNPAVLVFLCFVVPWQWTVTRAAVGVAVVVR
jgi:hypothetical protein